MIHCETVFYGWSFFVVVCETILVLYGGRMPRETPALCGAGTQWLAPELGMGKTRPCRISSVSRMT